MKKTLSKYKKVIIIFSLFYIPLIFISTFKIDYSMISPGFNDNINQFIEIESSNESKGSFHTTSVIGVDGITYLQYALGKNDRKIDVSPFPEHYDNLVVSDLVVRSYLGKEDSLYTSLIIAIDEAGLEINYEVYWTVYLTWNYLDPDTLEIGDKILDVKRDGVSISTSEIECLDTVVFTVLRGEDTLDFTVTKNQVNEDLCSIGISVDLFSEITSTEVEYNLIETITSGSSGGLMQTLYIYDRLTSFDYTHGLRIAGTGTIGIWHGDVGAIGGIEQKIYTSAINNIDIFFVPFAGGNYDDAMIAYNSINSDMIIVGVNDFNDVVTYLLNYEGGATND